MLEHIIKIFSGIHFQATGGTSSMVNPFSVYAGNNVNNERPNLIGDGAFYTYSQSLSLNNLTSNRNLWSFVSSSVSSSRSIGSAIHKMYGTPSYPTQWSLEPNIYLKQPLSGSSLSDYQTIMGSNFQWNRVNYGHDGYPDGWNVGNNAYGFFILSVTPNRIGNNFIGDVLVPTQTASGSKIDAGWQLGCQRPYGTYITFTPLPLANSVPYRVMYPIFTSDCLTYNSSERMDIEVVAIGQPSTGYDISDMYPISGDVIDDTIALLGLIT